MPDDLKHRLPYAFVTQRAGTLLNEEKVKRYVLANAPHYMHPRRVFFLPELPLTGAGKIDRKAIEAKAQEFAVSSSQK